MMAGRKNVRSKGAIDPTAGAAGGKAGTKTGMLLTPEQIAASGTEHAHQAAAMQWVAIEGLKRYANLDLLFAIPNGGDRKPSVAASLRAEGVKPGVPDLCLPIPAGRYAGLYLETKTPEASLKTNMGRHDAQIRWHVRLIEMGYAVVLAAGWKGIAKAIELYYAGELVMPQSGDALPVDENGPREAGWKG